MSTTGIDRRQFLRRVEGAIADSSAAGAMAEPICACSSPIEPTSPPIKIAFGPQLFLDDYVVERMDGLRREVPIRRSAWTDPFWTAQRSARRSPTRACCATPRHGDSGCSTTTAPLSGMRNRRMAFTGEVRAWPGTARAAIAAAWSTMGRARPGQRTDSRSRTGPPRSTTGRAMTAACGSVSRRTASTGLPTTKNPVLRTWPEG